MNTATCTRPAGTPRQNEKKDKKRILIVDDEPSITTMLQMLFEWEENYHVKAENLSQRAVTTAEQFKPDLVFMDVMMPTVDGGELASRFQANPRLKSVPIVFLTASVTKREVAKHGGCIGGLPFLAKPVDLNEILGCARRMLTTP